MHRMRRGRWLAAPALGLMVVATASANMRAPRNLENAPSAALQAPLSLRQATPTLRVQAETLKIDCDYERCQVQARYQFMADRAARLTFTFVMPDHTPVTAVVAGRTVQAELTADTRENAGTKPGRSAAKESTALFQAVFAGDVVAGENTVQVDYVQPLSLFERAYGYFTQSRSVEKFVYQMGPLREWTLAEDFSLAVSLSSPRARPERDGWSLFKSRSIDCGSPRQSVKKDGDRILLSLVYARDFPDTFVCRMGDSDLLGGHDD